MLLSFPRPPPLLSSKTLNPRPHHHHFPSPFPPKPTLLLLLSPNPNTHPPSLLACAPGGASATASATATASASSPSYETVAKSAIRRISDKLRSLGYLDDSATSSGDGGNAGEIFVPTPKEIPKYRVGSTLDPSWSTPESPVPEPGAAPAMARFRELWWRERQRERIPEEGKEAAQPPSVAELTIPPAELRRLRGLGIRITKRLKVGKAGITEGIVNAIHERWRRSELVKIKCEDLCRINMKRTHEILERKTGGLVVWGSGTIIILYRGANYKYPYFHDRAPKDENLNVESSEESSSEEEDEDLDIMPSELSSSGEKYGNVGAVSLELSSSRVLNGHTRSLREDLIDPPPSGLRNGPARSSLVPGVGSPNKVRFQLPGEVKLAEEADKLLDGLGPRFSDWWGCDPLPVDADLLPAIIPGYRRPFRLLPFGIKPKLTDREMTILRRLSRPLPCHFALGRNRNLQGLAASMIKLWEKCEVAKIAIKRGVQNTNNEIIAEELKRLTGGTLLSRDKEFIVFYRGKDFLPPAVSLAIEERRKYGGYTTNKPNLNDERSVPTKDISESKLASNASVHEHLEKTEKETSAIEKRPKSVNLAVQTVETKLSQAIAKKERAERLLAKLERTAEPPEIETDKEAISEEERYMLRKIGLRMKPFLLLGRRGVFDGTIENMHLHWKYRELVKIIFKERRIKNVEYAARILEAESGGILVAVEKVSKGHAIIVYRGKNYRRPATLRPKSLLNKRAAMMRSLEAQRSKSLKLHVLNLSKNIDELRNQMIKEKPMAQSIQMNSDHQHAPTHGISTNSEENIEEVHEVASEHINSKDGSCMSGERDKTINTTAMDLVKCSVTMNDMQSESITEEHKDDSSEAGIQFLTECTSNTTLNNMTEHSQIQICSTSQCISHHRTKEYLQDGGTSSKPCSPVHESKLNEESDAVPFRAAPLSNRERLILRKQALKMRKRPVIAVGRNNIISGVVKTIKTHFKKHPLAIVNIKGRAEGTPVQQLIFELEEATGAVLVSREPNKVILYRGWGEGGMQQRVPKENNVDKSRELKEVVSPQLMEAIRLECGLHSGEGE